MKFSLKSTAFELKALGLELTTPEPHLVVTVETAKLKDNHRDHRRMKRWLRPIADEILEITAREPGRSVPLEQWAAIFRFCESKAGETTALKTMLRFIIPMAMFEGKTDLPAYFVWTTAGTNTPHRVIAITHKEYRTPLPEPFTMRTLAHFTRCREHYEADLAHKAKVAEQVARDRAAREATQRAQKKTTAPVATVAWVAGGLGSSGD